MHTPQQEKQPTSLNSAYLKQIVSQGQKRYETNFEELQTLVHGGFYSIVKVLNKIDQQIYAIKKIEISLNKLQTEVNIQRVLKEVRYMAQLSHPNIMRYYNSWIEMVEQDSKVFLLSQSDLISPLQCNYDKDYKIRQYGDLFTYCLNNQQTENHTSLERISYSEVDSSSDSSDNSNYVPQKQTNQQCKSYGREKDIEKIMIFIQTEFCDQSLEDYILKRNNEIFKVTNNQEQLNQLTGEYFKNSYEISLNLISALEYIHQQCQLIHRDLRPSNIFINNEKDLRIGDFGLMKKIKLMLGNGQKIENFQYGYIKEETAQQNTHLFQAPELVSENIFKQYDHRVDIFTFGLILLILFYPTKTQSELNQVIQDVKLRGIIPFRLIEKNKTISEIILSCIDRDPNKRYSLKMIRAKIIDSQSQGSTNDIEIVKLGSLLVQFEDDDEKIRRYITIAAKQLHIYKTSDCNKAQIIYNLSECHMLIENEELLISHPLLMSIRISNFSLEQIIYLKKLLFQ